MFNKAIRGFLDTANGWAKTGVDGCFKVVFVPAKGVAGMALGEDHFVTRAESVQVVLRAWSSPGSYPQASK